VIRLRWDGWVVAEDTTALKPTRRRARATNRSSVIGFMAACGEAADAGLKRNNIIKLNIKQPDRMEEAWKRVLLGWGSKKHIVKACGVGDGAVATLRRAVRLVQQQRASRHAATINSERRASRPTSRTVGYWSRPLRWLTMPHAPEHCR
jgi:hypothetical protein